MTDTPTTPTQPPPKRKRSPRQKRTTPRQRAEEARDRIAANTKHLLSLVPQHALPRAKDIRAEITNDTRFLFEAMILNSTDEPPKT